MRIDPRDMRDTASYWPQGLANGHLFTHCLVEESKGENELFLFTWYIFRLTFRSLSDVSYAAECRTKCFQYAKRMFPLSRAVVKFCSSNRLFINNNI